MLSTSGSCTTAAANEAVHTTSSSCGSRSSDAGGAAGGGGRVGVVAAAAAAVTAVTSSAGNSNSGQQLQPETPAKDGNVTGVTMTKGPHHGGTTTNRLSNLKPFFYGGVAACIAEAATFPIDTAKTRLQLQGQAEDARHTGTKYRGMLHCLRRVSAEEGPRVLYSGIAPALVRQAVYGTFKYGLYYTIKDKVVGAEGESAATNFCCAVTAGALSSALANPTDVLKVRMQSRSEARAQTTFWSMCVREGVRGLWRGVCPTATRAALVAGVQLPTYDFAKSFFFRHRLCSVQDSAFNHLMSSFVAGLCACMISSPCDVVRTRMMDQRRLRKGYNEGQQQPLSGGSGGKAAGAVYKSATECLTATVRNEGFLALYRGFVPAFMRMGPWNIIFFLVYERLKHI